MGFAMNNRCVCDECMYVCVWHKIQTKCKANEVKIHRQMCTKKFKTKQKHKNQWHFYFEKCKTKTPLLIRMIYMFRVKPKNYTWITSVSICSNNLHYCSFEYCIHLFIDESCRNVCLPSFLRARDEKKWIHKRDDNMDR